MTERSNHYIVATVKPWNIEAFHQHTQKLEGQWHLITEKEQLNHEILETLNPRYIFFPHWSWIVPKSILNSYECVCFHMTDVPYGRGGSPLQNLISRGHRETRLTALQMSEVLDAGPVYRKTPLCLTGSAQEIYMRAGHKVWDLITEIVEDEPSPTPQSGKQTIFKRRTPDMSKMPNQGDVRMLYDHIRMLDAETYPHAFLEHGTYRYEFTEAVLDDDGALTARVKIKPIAKKDIEE